MESTDGILKRFSHGWSLVVSDIGSERVIDTDFLVPEHVFSDAKSKDYGLGDLPTSREALRTHYPHRQRYSRVKGWRRGACSDARREQLMKY
jgi:hypothetical protein